MSTITDAYVLNHLMSAWRTRTEMHASMRSAGFTGMSDRQLAESLRRLVKSGRVEMRQVPFIQTIYRLTPTPAVQS
ncbi:MAG: hypothetical protein WCA20_10275 [Candidatus Sulfotelmatobacter sp.]